ncbi:hypothetical protein GHT06_016052 [Daphnia sinensis]|uniref:Uncharacterized protein n=1 Tax=Daphnia sinensis TaxID=1820382 RepID=A0AAD5LK81_9CRUS|nr:hypothetical protein GHT06_016052 [Daphnia sinensis]
MLALILSACIILSHQHYMPDYGQRGLFWIPYLLPLPRVNHYRPVYYEYPEEEVFHDSQAFAKPLEQPNEHFGGVEGRNNHRGSDDGTDGTLGDDYPDVQLRMNKPDARLFLLGGDSTFDNPFWKTITLTLMSTVNVTRVQPCLPAGQFTGGSANVICQRKKRIALEDSPAISEDSQFAIHPSKPLPLMTTSVATIDQSNSKNRETITSSKDDMTVGDDENDRLQYPYREMRFLNNYVTVTEYSYTFNSFTVTKTVSLLSTVGVPRLVCRPSGFVVC